MPVPVLESLKDVFDAIHEECQKIPRFGVILVPGFKNAFVSYIEKNAPCGYKKVEFGLEMVSLLNKSGQLSYIPLSGFLFAHKLVRYYKLLIKYKGCTSSLSPEEVKDAKDGKFSENAEKLIRDSVADDESVSCLKRFLSDYLWWGGGKGIDRSDFYVSPLMKCAGLQAESQSGISDLTKILASDSDLYEKFSFFEGVSSDKSLLQKGLNVFAEKREKEWRSSEYVKVNADVRSYYAMLTPDKIRTFSAEGFREFCCEHTWAGKVGAGWAQLSKSDLGACSEFFADLLSKPSLPSKYWSADAPRPSGIGNALVSELLMKFHPEDFGLYNSSSHEALSFLGLLDGSFRNNFSASDYAFVQGRLEEIRREMVKLKIDRTLEENSGEADFITVNEFLWFVRNNRNLIRETMMSTQLKPTEHKVFDGGKDLSNLQGDSLMLRLTVALRTKPFVILAGHSGTGKSRTVRKLAYMTCCEEGLRGGDVPGNFCMVQVKPNWHDSTELLGYYSPLSRRYETTEFVRFLCKAYAYPDIPFFVCLDEMNLAPVEQYFAEYLSALESVHEKDSLRLSDALVPKEVYGTAADLGAESVEAAEWIGKHGLSIPKNLFVVGTVNMDETTCQFSRKVLDRAMTIEMNEIDFDKFGEQDSVPSFDDTLKFEETKKLLAGECRAKNLSNKQKELLNSLKSVLAGTPFAVAYRFANEYALYTESLNCFVGGNAENEKTAFDHMVLMKVLPRIIGERETVKDIFEMRGGGGLKSLFPDGEKSLSREKMDEILGRKESYLSFWP